MGQPSSPSLLLRCALSDCSILVLDNICQISFAECHTKRNLVERAHAEENSVRSRHGPFKSNAIHQHVIVGTKEHKDNMEHMAEEVLDPGGSQLEE